MDWLKNLKANDPVIVAGGGFYGCERICTVEKITPSGMVKVENELYNQDGQRRGSSGAIYPNYLKEATPEAIQKIKDDKMMQETVRFFTHVTKDKLTIDQWRRINAILKEAQK